MNDEPSVHAPFSGLAPPPDFATFMRDHQDRVYSTAVRLVSNPAEAEDIAQEVFLRAYRHFEALRSSPAAGGWLRTVATNLSLNHLQRYRRRWTFFSELAKGEGDESEPVDFPDAGHFFGAIDARQRREWVEAALASLPPHQRVPLVLYHFEELSYEEIAERLGVSLSKLKTDILRGRSALARILARQAGSREFLSSAQ